uniref:Si:ch211-105d4.5 (inferred by orthology to a zebrafish protein) n=1 Tax=Strongyloides venezuelensis TaxID=75913 RepID=A0A0K0G1V8_STRVS
MSSIIFVLLILISYINLLVNSSSPYTKLKKCQDKDMSCYLQVAEDPTRCEKEDFVIKNCLKSCQKCDGLIIPPEYDLKKVPPNLKRIAFLIGKWRSDFGGKADFPTIPRFTYGEEIDFRLANLNSTHPSLNYTAFAWEQYEEIELHSETGYLTMDSNGTTVALTTVMSNGFATVEEGIENGNAIEFRLKRIGRVNFSRDLPVRRVSIFLILFKLFLLDDENMDADERNIPRIYFSNVNSYSSYDITYQYNL